jgi:hypothetical protein
LRYLKSTSIRNLRSSEQGQPSARIAPSNPSRFLSGPEPTPAGVPIEPDRENVGLTCNQITLDHLSVPHEHPLDQLNRWPIELNPYQMNVNRTVFSNDAARWVQGVSQSVVSNRNRAGSPNPGPPICNRGRCRNPRGFLRETSWLGRGKPTILLYRMRGDSREVVRSQGRKGSTSTEAYLAK